MTLPKGSRFYSVAVLVAMGFTLSFSATSAQAGVLGLGSNRHVVRHVAHRRLVRRGSVVHRRAGPATPVAPVRNSAYCGYTFFTNKDDNLDFRNGGGVGNCFDLKGGNDTLILNRTAYPKGARIWTGTGRDQVWATDGNDTVIDPDGQDKQIWTYGGDDRIDIRTAVQRDPFRGVKSTERSDIYPGSGKNKLFFGRDLYTDGFPRTSPNAWVWTAPGAQDSIDAACGRPTVGNVDDITIGLLPETSSDTIHSDGCGIAIFGAFGDVSDHQAGGRFVLQTSGDKFRARLAKTLPTLDVNVSGGEGALIDLSLSNPRSSLTWEGEGTPTVRSNFREPGSGGVFSINSIDDIQFEGYSSASTVRFTMAAEGVIDMHLHGVAAQDLESFNIAGSRMQITWTYDGGFGFPEISNTHAQAFEHMSFKLPKIDWPPATPSGKPKPHQKPGRTAEAATSPLIQDPDKPVNPDLPKRVARIAQSVKRVEVQPGGTRLVLRLRQANDATGPCVSVHVIDETGKLPEKTASCKDASGPLTQLKLENAQGYDQIRISGEGVSKSIAINGTSGFDVNALEIDL